MANTKPSAEQIIYTPAGTGAVATTVQGKLRESVSVLSFGAKGDWNGTTGTDDRAAIQAALDYVGATGGGTVLLAKSLAGSGYRITSGLRIPAYVTLEGIAPVTYPYNGVTGASDLVADFVNVNQWVIDGASLLNGAPVPYNVTIVQTDTYTFSFNNGVRNLRIAAVNTIPFGGIRMVACPGSMVIDVGIVGTGCGMLLGQTFGGNYRVFCLTHYYGVILWDEANANTVDCYCAQHDGPTAVVPVGYLMPFMNALSTTLVSIHKLTTNNHHNRTWGVIVGARSTTVSAGNRINCTLEQFSGGVFQSQSFGTVFNNLYAESIPNVMLFEIVAITSRFVVNTLHWYTSQTGVIFDLGIAVNARVAPIGQVDLSYGTGPWLDGASSLVLDGIGNAFGPTVPQWNISYTGWDQNWKVPTLLNSWASIGGGNRVAGYRINGRTGNVEIVGLITGGAQDTIVFNLPVGYRPSENSRFAVFGGSITVTSGGDVISNVAATIDLSGASFQSLL